MSHRSVIAQESVDFFRALCDPLPSQKRPEVRINDVEPCSFVALGFLDGGAFRRALTGSPAEIARLLSPLRRSELVFEDVMWVAPSAWLTDISILLATLDPAADLLPRLAALQRVAETQRLDIAVSGTYGPGNYA